MALTYNVNLFGTNEKIHFHFNEELLKQNNFQYNTPLFSFPESWSYHKNWVINSLELCFYVRYYLKSYKGAQLDINVIDNDFGQPYDYQLILERHPYNATALKVRDLVEKEMEKLQAVGILSGHIEGEYI